MTGPKLNEGATVAGERAGTKAVARYVRMSASKARPVLDNIRGLDVKRADEVLQFTDRDAAKVIRKVLASAVANAVNNDSQDADELHVLACFADEGPTLKRFRPRARGRASRIRKRTCHITVVVARMSDERLAIIQAREAGRGAAGRRRTGTSAQSRRERVERSRQRAQALKSGATAPAAEEIAAGSSDAADAEGAAGVVTAEWEGSALPLADGSAPEGYEIKGNADSMLYHEPGSRYYAQTKAEVWFDTVEHAEAAGFSKAGASKAAADDTEPDTEPETGTETDAATEGDGGSAEGTD
jgi:large subunit ribosomal protein L22